MLTVISGLEELRYRTAFHKDEARKTLIYIISEYMAALQRKCRLVFEIWRQEGRRK